MFSGFNAKTLILGEKLTDPEVEDILKLAGPEDDDGFIKYERK